MERDTTKNNSQNKELISRGTKLIHYLFGLLLFMLCWDYFLKTNSILIASRYSLFIYALYAVTVFFLCRTYNAYLIEFQETGDIIFSLSLSSGISTIFIYCLVLAAWNKYYSPLCFILLIIIHIIWNAVWAICAKKLFYHTNRPMRTAVIYRNQRDLSRLGEISKFPQRYVVEKYIENPEDINTIIEQAAGYEAIFVAGVDASLRNGIAKFCVEEDIRGFFLPHIGDIIMSGSQHAQAFSVPIMNLRRVSENPEYLIFKRIMDIFLSILIIIITSPIMLLVAIAIKFDDGGPVFYRQARLTRNGKEFRIIKFRSMRTDAESDGMARLSTGSNDDRITRVGRVIRACRLDELPQLFNIFGGSMTFVGPRPERPEITELYVKDIPAFRLRLQVKAGLTGYAQVYGKYNTDPYDKLEMDLIYINKMNPLMDIQLMFATIRILFSKDSTEGISENSTTAMD